MLQNILCTEMNKNLINVFKFKRMTFKMFKNVWTYGMQMLPVSISV